MLKGVAIRVKIERRTIRSRVSFGGVGWDFPQVGQIGGN